MAAVDVTIGKTWKTVGSGDIAFVIEATQVRGGAIEVWVAHNGDGPSCLLTPTDARAIAAELIARAAYIEPECGGLMASIPLPCKPVQAAENGTEHMHSDDCKHVLGPLPVPGATTCSHCGDHHTSIEYCPQRCPMAHAALAELNQAGA